MLFVVSHFPSFFETCCGLDVTLNRTGTVGFSLCYITEKGAISFTNAKHPPPQFLYNVRLCFDCFQTFTSIPHESSAIQRSARTKYAVLGSCQCVPQSIFLALLLWENMQGLSHYSNFNPCLCKQIYLCPGNSENELNFSLSGIFPLIKGSQSHYTFLVNEKKNRSCSCVRTKLPTCFILQQTTIIDVSTLSMTIHWNRVNTFKKYTYFYSVRLF